MSPPEVEKPIIFESSANGIFPPRNYIFPKIVNAGFSGKEAQEKINLVTTALTSLLENENIPYLQIVFAQNDIEIIIMPAGSHRSQRVFAEFLPTTEGPKIYLYLPSKITLSDIKRFIRHEGFHAFSDAWTALMFADIPQVAEHINGRFFTGTITLNKRPYNSAYMFDLDVFAHLKSDLCEGFKKIFEIPDLLRKEQSNQLSEKEAGFLNSYYLATNHYFPPIDVTSLANENHPDVIAAITTIKNFLEFHSGIIMHMPFVNIRNSKYLLVSDIKMVNNISYLYYHIASPNNNHLENFVTEMSRLVVIIKTRHEHNLKKIEAEGGDKELFVMHELHAAIMELGRPILDLFFPNLLKYVDGLTEQFDYIVPEHQPNNLIIR